MYRKLLKLSRAILLVRVRGVEGTVLVNGAARSLQAFRKLQAYILQEDVLLPYLSAEECMMAAAALKLGAGLSERQRRQRVSEKNGQ